MMDFLIPGFKKTLERKVFIACTQQTKPVIL